MMNLPEIFSELSGDAPRDGSEVGAVTKHGAWMFRWVC